MVSYEDKELKFKNIQFIIDRYEISTASMLTATFTGDGSTKNFTLTEIIQEQDILVTKGVTASDGSTVNFTTAFVGDNVTADNNASPTYLTTDSQLRSADFENEISLTHDTTNKITTVNFTNAPDSGTIIRVDRAGDKYLVFRRIGI